MNIKDFKQKNPAYADVPDNELADALYKKHYADSMSKDDFYKQVGVSPNFTDTSIGQMWVGIGKGVRDAVTGGDRNTPEIRDMPEIGQIPGMGAGRFKQAIGTALATNDQDRANVVKNSHPGSVIRQDEKGNQIANVDGTDYAVNKPGLSAQDLYSLGIQGAGFGKAATAAGAGAKTLIGRVLKVGGATGTTSLGMDAAGNQAGTEKDVIRSVKDAGINAVLGGGAEVAAPFLQTVYQSVRKMMPSGRVVTPDGQIAPQVRIVLEQNGINPDSLGPDFIKQFATYADQMDPAMAARATEAATLPVPVRQTKGNVTLDPADQLAEQQMRTGTYGQSAGDVMRGIRTQQDEQLRANLPELQRQLSGGQLQVTQRGAGGEMVSNRLNQMYDAEKGAVDQAYGAARDTNAFLPGSAVDTGSQRIAGAVLEGHSLRSVPKVAGLIEDFNKLAPSDIDPVRVKDLFQWRQQMSGVRASGGEEAVAAGRAIKAFDETMDQSLERALLSGDDDAIALWREAIGKNKEFAQRFKGNDLVGKLTARAYDTNSRTLKVDPTSAANMILGQAKLGAVGRANMVPELKKLRAVLGPDSAEWNAIREEAFVRFAQTGEGGFSGAERGFSGVKFKKAWDDAWANDGPMMSQLFTQKEKETIDQFGRVAARTTNPVAGGSNNSGTAAALANIMKGVGNLPFFGGQASMAIGLPLLKDLRNVGEVASAANLPKRMFPAGYLGGAAATGYSNQ